MDPWDTNSQPPGTSAAGGDTGRLAGRCQCPYQSGSLPCEARAPAPGRRSSWQNPGWSLPGMLSPDPEEPQRSFWHGHSQRCWAQSTTGKEDDCQRHQNSLQVPLEKVLLLCLKLLWVGRKRNTQCHYWLCTFLEWLLLWPQQGGYDKLVGLETWLLLGSSIWCPGDMNWISILPGCGMVHAAISTCWTCLYCPRLMGAFTTPRLSTPEQAGSLPCSKWPDFCPKLTCFQSSDAA